MIKFIITNILASFSTNPGGFSGRKLSAFAGVVMAAYNLRFADSTIAVEMTITWLTFSLLALGIVTAEQVIKLKTGKSEEPKN
jgi:hypothetical protein